MGKTKGVKRSLRTSMLYTEYHNICATMIQRKWKKFILQKKIWYLLKPKHPINVKRRNIELDLICKAWKRIHAKTTLFKTFIVTFNYNLEETRQIEFTFIGCDEYSAYDIGYDEISYINKREALNHLKKIKNLMSINLKAIVTHLNFYGYPEVMKINVTTNT